MRKRPGIITAICIVGFIGVLYSLAMLESGEIPKTIGSWYPPFFAFSAVAGLVCMIGLWIMKKWSVIAYTCLFVLGQIILLANNVWTPLSFLIPLIVIGIGFSQFSKMDPVSKVSSSETKASQVTRMESVSEVTAPPTKTVSVNRKPQVAGILSIVSGAIGLIFWGTVFIVTVSTVSSGIGLCVFYAIASIVAIAAIVGGVYSIKRARWGLALGGAVCSVFAFWLLGIPAVILVTLSKKYFA